jgi:P pilus assembly chaperone PapD
MLRTPRALTLPLLVAALLVLPEILAAVYVSPTAVFMDERSRSTEITIGNAGDQPEEATIELKFGFPDVDSAGTPYVRFVEDPGPEFNSAADWVRAFPQRVRLAPHSQQVVRLLARPPDSLPDGEYYSRMIITGRGASLPLNTADSALHAGLNLEIRLVTSVTYRKGRITTGVAIRGLTAEADGDSLSLWAHMERSGNGAYLGTAEVELLNQRNTILRRWATQVAVHYPVRRRFSYPLDSLPVGDYKVRFRLRTRRPDLPEDRVLQAPTVVDSVAVRVF